MKSTKTLNISPDLHKRVKVQATHEGWNLGDYADALLEVGLSHPDEVKIIMDKLTTDSEETKL
jgi:hypothetical protein